LKWNYLTAGGGAHIEGRSEYWGFLNGMNFLHYQIDYKSLKEKSAAWRESVSENETLRHGRKES